MSSRRSRRVVVGYDATAASERALSWALRRAGRKGRVVVVHAGGPDARAVAELPFLERADVFDAVGECSWEVRDLAPADALMDVAAGIEADEIVVGTRRRERLRTGSVCSELLSRSDCPVVVIP